MSNLQTPRVRAEWMPNRMFDPVSNPFAIQNLLQTKVENFVEIKDERSDAAFELDSLVASSAEADFSVTTMEDASAQAENQEAWTDQAAAASAEFGTDDAAADFSADPTLHPTPVTENAATAADTAEATEPELGADPESAADAALSANADAEFAAIAAALDELAASDHGVTAELASAAEPPFSSSTDAEATDVSQPLSEMGQTEQPVDQPAEQPVVETAEQPAEQGAEQQPVAAHANSGMSNEALEALLTIARTEASESAHQAGYAEGLAAGIESARHDLQQAFDDRIARVQNLLDSVHALSTDPDALFEPVKKLAIHLAEQLVRGELVQSPQVISRLVDNAMRELNASGDKAVIAHLNPEDLEAYRPLVAQFSDSLILRPDAALERGSVRVALDGSVVEDLMQRRSLGLKNSLSQAAAPSWRAGGARLSGRLAEGQRGAKQVEDVTLAPSAARTQSGSVAEVSLESPEFESVTSSPAGEGDA